MSRMRTHSLWRYPASVDAVRFNIHTLAPELFDFPADFVISGPNASSHSYTLIRKHPLTAESRADNLGTVTQHSGTVYVPRRLAFASSRP